METVDKGTNTIPDAAPLMMMGQSIEVGEMSIVMCAIWMLVIPKTMKPVRISDAVIDFAGKERDHRHDADRADAARAHGPTRRAGRVAEQCLIEKRQQRDHAVNDAAEQAQSAVEPIAKLRLQNTFTSTSGCAAPNSRTMNADQAGDDDYRRPADPDGAEPIVFLSLIEHDLKRPDPESQQPEADGIDLADLRILDVRRVDECTARS